MQYHISISFSIIFQYFVFVFSSSFSYFTHHKTHSTIQLQCLIRFHHNPLFNFNTRTIQKIFTKLQTFLHEVRNHEKIVLIFLKNIFNITSQPYPSILLVSIGIQVATFIGIPQNIFESFLELSYHFFFSKSKGQILDGVWFLLRSMLRDTLKQFGYCH